ncbi:hypothetical protein KCU92_g3529, partial [Aureobasidium melanogenum]
AAGIPTWSPTVVLICRSTAYVWQSGRDAQFSADCGRTCSSHLQQFDTNRRKRKGLDPGYLDNPQWLGVLQQFNQAYGHNISRELMAHACSFYNNWSDRFPDAFDPAVHLDYFVIWYDTLVYIRRHPKRPQPDDTIQQFGHEYVIDSLQTDFFGDNDEIAQCNRRLITPENVPDLLSLSPIATENAKVDLVAKLEHNDTVARIRELGFDLSDLLTEDVGELL